MIRDALVVGINQYQDDRLRNLNAPALDAEAIAEILEKYGKFNVVSRLPEAIDPGTEKPYIAKTQELSLTNLEKALVKLFKPKGRQVPDTALFYFSGHGLRKDLGIQEGFLATSDVNPSLSFYGLSLQWLRRLLQESPIRQQIIWLDCCHSGELLNFNEADPGEQGQARDRCFIAASREFEPAYQSLDSKYSVLTKVLLDGLDPNRCPQQWITNYSLIEFINQNLCHENQRPVFTNFGSPINLTQTLDTQTPVPIEKDSKDICPYKGLEYFDFNDEDPKYFYGREKLTDKLIDRVRQSNFLAILGASGSGKSSVLRAGLLHQLKLGRKLAGSQDWKIKIMLPGEHPLQSLALSWLESDLSDAERATQLDQIESLLQQGGEGLRKLVQASTANRVILVIDQFEQVFTLCQDLAKREAFFQCVLEGLEQTDKKLCLILAMRIDFFSKCVERKYSGLGQKIETNLISILPMKPTELTKVIEKPAEKLGVTFEAGLVERILDDVEDEPGNLPLLEFALTQLWKKKIEKKLTHKAMEKKLTHKAYETIGRVKGALAQYADKKYKNLTTEEQERARRIFIQLVHPGAGTEDTRRRANSKELGEDNWNLITRKDGLADSRLVITNRNNDTEPETVEIVHEALIQNWGQLREWMEIDREFRIWQEKFKARIKEWKEGKGELLSKTRLKIAEGWLQKREKEISNEEKKFITDSLKEQQKQMNNQKIVKRFGVIVSILFSMVVSILGTLYYKRISCDVGEKVGQDCFRFIITNGDSKLFVGTTNTFLQDGIKNFDEKKFKDAKQNFEKAQTAARFDPIPLIYHNNAKALSRGNSYKLAVVVPVDAHEEIARNILRGVAYAQEEFNNKREKSVTPLLEIIIANDKNNKDIAEKIAKRLIRKNVLGVIGHRSSGSSLSALPIYEAKGIAMISPTSSSTQLDENNVFFRAVASNGEFAKNFYEYAKENCFNENNNNYVWFIYDSEAEYSKNLKKEFDNYKKDKEELKQKFETISLNDLSKKNPEEIKSEIETKISEGVKCTILIPSTKTTSTAISIVYLQSEIEQSKEEKMQFLSGLALHNDETLKRDGSSFEQDLKIAVPVPQLDKNILKKIEERWGENINWRTYTSYKATQYLISGLKKLDNKNISEKNTVSKKQKLILYHLNSKDSPIEESLESCIMDSQDIKDNKYEQNKCFEPLSEKENNLFKTSKES